MGHLAGDTELNSINLRSVSTWFEFLAFLSAQYSDYVTSWMTEVRFPAWTGMSSLRHEFQTASVAHPASYPVDISPGHEEAGA